MSTQVEEKHDQSHITAEQVTAIAALLVVGAAAQATASRVATVLGLPVASVGPLVRLALSTPIHIQGARPADPSAASFTWDAEPAYRAAYIQAASERVHRNVRQGMPVQEAVRRERVFYKAHVRAQQNRFTRAKEVDRIGKKFNGRVGWYAVLDRRTSIECKQANGKNFQADKMPLIGYPGAVHLECRCKAGPPHKGGASLPSVRKAA